MEEMGESRKKLIKSIKPRTEHDLSQLPFTICCSNKLVLKVDMVFDLERLYVG